MGRKGGNYGLPSWYLRKGKKLLDYHDGSEIYQLDPSTQIQYGNPVHKKNFDSLTEAQRNEQIRRKTR